MSQESRIKRWRANKRQQGLKHISLWLTEEEELRLKDLAIQLHCSASEVVRRALAQFSASAPEYGSPTDTLQIRELIQEELAILQAEVTALGIGLGETRGELAAMKADKAPVTETIAEIVATTLGQDLPTLVCHIVEGLALEALGLPATDTNGSPTDTLPSESHAEPTPAHAYEPEPGHSIVTEPARARPASGQFKLTPLKVAEMKGKRSAGVPIKALMEEYGISRATLFRYLKEA